MIHRVIRICHWVIDFLFAVDGYDEEGVLSCLYDMDASYDVMLRANKIMTRGKLNRAFTYVNPEIKRALVMIGPTSSGRQFQNSFEHEIRHLINAIALSLGYQLDEEGPSYMSGDTTMALADVVCMLGCDHCRAK